MPEIKNVEKIQYFFGINFVLFPDERISFEEREVFNTEFVGFYWSLHQDGFLVKTKLSNIRTVSYIVDTEDERTLTSLGNLKEIFSSSSSEKAELKKEMKIRVYLLSDEGYEIDSDWIVYDTAKLAFLNFRESWGSVLATQSEIKKAINEP